MPNQEHLDLLKQGVETWNAWRTEHPQIKPDLEDADLNGMELRNIYFDKACLRGANLSRTFLSRADLRNADLSGATLCEVDLRKSMLQGTHLNGSDLTGADLRHAHAVYAHLNEANLNYADFGDANLWEADFTRANLEHASFDFASLNAAKLNGARLIKASFWRTRLDRTSLVEADLTGAYLRESDLSEVTLAGADLSNAVLQGTIFGNVDLSEVKGLETIWHAGCSYVDIHTLLRSQGRIPEIFLRGVGFPESAIEYTRTLNETPFSYASCFLVYGNDDQDFADQLYADLQRKGVRCWLACCGHKDDRDMLYHESRSNRELGDEAMQAHDKVLLVLSERTFREWASIGVEVMAMLEQEQKFGLQVLIALRIDQSQWENLPNREWVGRLLSVRLGYTLAMLQERPPLDFAGWKDPESYQNAFNRLLHVLKNEPLRALDFI